MFENLKKVVVPSMSVLLCFFVLAEVNYIWLKPQSAIAVFVMLGLCLCFLIFPAHKKLEKNKIARWIDVGCMLGTIVSCCYVIMHTEPLFKSFWIDGESLASRVGVITSADVFFGTMGLVLVLEGTRRSIGIIVPILALLFVFQTYYCFASFEYDLPELPGWLLPHSGQNFAKMVNTTFLQTQGVFGQAAGVMFKFVFLFVVFGAFLEMSGATQFIIDFAERVFGRSPGGPAKISVLGSGMMGSLSGSAVANAVTTGAFTIPMMRNAGFERHVAGGITAAAAAGGALVPPVMGAGAYMMLDLVVPQVTFVQIAKAAIIPAVLYYLSIFMIVHFHSRRLGRVVEEREPKIIKKFDAFVFCSALGVLVVLLANGFSASKSVTGSLIVILLLTVFRKELPLSQRSRIFAASSFVVGACIHHFGFADEALNTRKMVEGGLNSALVGMFALLIFGLIDRNWRPSVMKALGSSSRNGVSLVAASACVGIIIAIVDQSGTARLFGASIKSVVDDSLLLALLGIMTCSIVLGMGVPSVVCYLLMANLMGPLLSELGVIPLAAHLFIFYYGMMSMVTPPVALAAYASASIAEAPVMKTALAAFRFALVGFTLPFMFVYRPELCLMVEEGQTLSYFVVAMHTGAAIGGVVALAAGLAGFFTRHLGPLARVGMFASAALLLYPGQGTDLNRILGDYIFFVTDIVGSILLIVIFALVKSTPAPPKNTAEGSSSEKPALA